MAKGYGRGSKKKIWNRKTKKGTSVTTQYVPTKGKSKKVKSFSYVSSDKKGGSSRKFVLTTTISKVYKTASAFAKAKKQAVKTSKK